MLNTAREISQMIFTLDNDINFNDVNIKKGLNSIHRIDNQYHVFRIPNNGSYAVLADKQMHNLLKVVFSGMLKGDFIHDEEDIVPQKKLLRKIK